MNQTIPMEQRGKIQTMPIIPLTVMKRPVPPMKERTTKVLPKVD